MNTTSGKSRSTGVTRANIEEFAYSAGADLIGIANMERFESLAVEHHPATIFPEARSVIIIGRRILRGSLRGVEEGTQFNNFALYGYDWLDNRFLAITTIRIAEYLEDNNYEAVPIANLPKQIPPMGVSVREGAPAPNVMVDFDDAAVRAGLGEINYGGIFISPRFGPRQRFQVILTDAEFDPTPLPAETICDIPPETYANFCPLGAISPTESQTLKICGKEMTVAEIDYSKCRQCKNGARPNIYHESGNPDRQAALCTRSCIAWLEAHGKISDTFAVPFRRRPLWEVVDGRVYIEEGSEIE